MKKPLVIDPEVLRHLEQLQKEEKVECLLALLALPNAFGNPHAHSGLSIRKLTKNTFEFRGNIGLRFLFQSRADAIYVAFLGNHDQVRLALRTGRFD